MSNNRTSHSNNHNNSNNHNSQASTTSEESTSSYNNIYDNYTNKYINTKMQKDGGNQYEVKFENSGKHRNGGLQQSGNGTSGPVDLDELFESQRNIRADDEELSFFEDDDDETMGGYLSSSDKFYSNPHKRLLDKDASLIPGSPFSKPSLRRTNRPDQPLTLAKYASTAAFILTFTWVIGYIVYTSYTFKANIGRLAIEVVLACLSFFGLFWNSYYVISSIAKCFIPSKAFTTNTKYCSIIPEGKPKDSDWLGVTIQIPVYKESLHEVLMPTLKSCMLARDTYQNMGGDCNIVMADDGIMALLHDNFPAAEMLWKSIQESQGKVFRLSKLLKHVPRASRRHLKGLRSKDVYEVFHRMLYYYHSNIGFVARSTVDRRGKFKKASNLNAHLRLALGAQQLTETEPDLTIVDALLEESHNADGSRYIMFGNNVLVGDLICINDADARMAPTIIHKTVPEFLNDPNLGFTQHATKTMNEQRTESYFTRMLTVYTDALYQGHFLLSSILGCHPPLVGHSIFLRTEAVNQVGRMRTLRSAQRWLKNIGLPFLPVDQVGFGNLQAKNRTEYWSESHVSEDFELMIHLYNLGFNGRYCAYPDTEFQEGITRTFDEEAGRHRKFALGAHELCFNSFEDMLGNGIFTDLFRTFLSCNIPSYYKIFLTAYLCSYSSGGTYIIVFVASAVVRIMDNDGASNFLYYFSPAGVIILNFVVYYVIGYFTFILSLLRMNWNNQKLLFPEYRKKYGGTMFIIYTQLRYGLVFQFLFYNVAAFPFFFLGSMDHLLARPGVVGATNKDSISIGRCVALWDTIKFNIGSWSIALILLGLAYLTVLQDYDWDYTAIPEGDKIIQHALFAGPSVILATLTIFVPIILNPWILGWPFLRKPSKKELKKQEDERAKEAAMARQQRQQALARKNGGSGNTGTTAGAGNNTASKPQQQKPLNQGGGARLQEEQVVGLNTLFNATKVLSGEIERAQHKPDVELGSLATKEISAASPSTRNRKVLDANNLRNHDETTRGMNSIQENYGRNGNRQKRGEHLV